MNSRPTDPPYSSPIPVSQLKSPEYHQNTQTLASGGITFPSKIKPETELQALPRPILLHLHQPH